MRDATTGKDPEWGSITIVDRGSPRLGENGRVGLEFTLSARVDDAWITAFNEVGGRTGTIDTTTGAGPTVRANKIAWSVVEGDLEDAWTFVSLAVVRANESYRDVLAQREQVVQTTRAAGEDKSRREHELKARLDGFA